MIINLLDILVTAGLAFAAGFIVRGLLEGQGG
jgi:hypothetical protein